MFELHARRVAAFQPRGVSACAWTQTFRSQAVAPVHLIDTTMLFAPRSGGVKRYLLAKRAWSAEQRPGVRHTLVVPGAATRPSGKDVVTVAAARLPFADGYRWPASIKKWGDQLVALRPDLIEAGDPYGPGRAALDAGERLGVPVVGFCHSDPTALAALHLGSWAEAPVRRRWAQLFRRFDQVVAPSRHIAERLSGAGVFNVRVVPLGVDTKLFDPGRGDPDRIRRQLGLSPTTRLLVFAGRPAKEKNVEVMLDTVARLGSGYHLLLIGAGLGAKPQANASFLDFQRDPHEMARLLASCDAFLHANDREAFGLVVLEAMASGLPVIGVGGGGVSEIVDDSVGRLAPRPTAEALAEAVDAVFAGDVPAMSAEARRRAVAQHGWSRTFSALSKLYGELSGQALTPHVPYLRLARTR